MENQALTPSKQDFLFASVTEYDIDCEKCYDIIFARAKQVMFTSNEGEKIQVRLASDRIANIQSALKVKIDDVKKKIDVHVHRFGSMTETMAKEALYIFVRLPRSMLKGLNFSGTLKH